LPVAAGGAEPPRAEPSAADARIRMVDSGAPSVPPTPGAPASPPPDWELSFENAITSAPPRPSGPRPAEKGPENNPFDDLEFLKTMVDRNTGEHGVVGAGREKAAEPAAAPPASEPVVTMPTTPPVKQRPSQPVPAAASGLPLIMPDAPPPPRSEPRFPQAGGRDSVPSYLKESPPEQVKTLKCQECGTLNYPTEWYCERCGAELAAL
jgi:hypothetical protein